MSECLKNSTDGAYACSVYIVVILAICAILRMMTASQNAMVPIQCQRYFGFTAPLELIKRKTKCLHNYNNNSLLL